MPFYQYFCEQNQITIEVYHPMSQRLRTWGQVCQAAGIDPGAVPLESPVVRLIGQSMPVVWRLKGLDKDAPSKRLRL